METEDFTPRDSFDEALIDNLTLVLEMLDCMGTELAFAERHIEAEFINAVGKALALLMRVRPDSSR